MVPHRSDDTHAATRCIPRLQGQGSHDAHSRRHSDVCMPPHFRARPVDQAHRLHRHHSARRVVLARSRRPVAFGTQAGGRPVPRFGLLGHLLDTEPRSVGLPAHHRQNAPGYQPRCIGTDTGRRGGRNLQLYGTDACLCESRCPRLLPRHLAQTARHEEPLRFGTAQRQKGRRPSTQQRGETFSVSPRFASIVRAGRPIRSGHGP